jgi:hypothetical protein
LNIYKIDGITAVDESGCSETREEMKKEKKQRER